MRNVRAALPAEAIAALVGAAAVSDLAAEFVTNGSSA